MGRKSVPTALKIVRGNPGKRPLNQDEPQPEPATDDDMPAHLSDAARAHWAVVAQQLRDAKMLGRVDALALALYCEAFARWKDASDHVAKNGPVVTSPRSGYPVQSPYLNIANKAHDQMVKLLTEFGMTPSSRSRVSKVEDDNASPYAAYAKKTPRAGTK